MKDTDNWKEVSIQAESVSEIFPKGAGRKISKAMQKENYKPEKRRKLKTGEVEVMKGKGSRQKWFYLKNKEEVKQLIKLGRNSAFPTGITNNNSRVKFDKGLHIKESVNERKLSSLQKKAMSIAIEMSGNMTGAVKKIEKLKKGLSKDKKVVNALKVSNESVNESIQLPHGMELGKLFTGHGKSFVKIKESLPTKITDKFKKLKDEPEGDFGKDFSQHHKGSMGDDMGSSAEHDTYDFDDGGDEKAGNKTEKDKKKTGYEPVTENEDVGAETILGGIVQSIQKAGLKPKSAKLMKSGFKVSKRDKVGFVIDVEIRGFDKKEIHKMQFEVERGMLYLILNNKPVKLGKWTMGTMVTKNLKKVALTLSGQKGSPKRIA
jgi:hypothetical protein